MGNCFKPATEQSKRDKLMNSKISSDTKRTRDEIKLLLLGAGESGKSTIFKQMKIIHQKGYSDKEKEKYKKFIYQNVFQCINTLIEACDMLGYKINDPEIEKCMDKISDIPQQKIILHPTQVMNEEIGKIIYKIWKNPTIQKTYSKRNQFQLLDSCDYYLNSILEISKPNYQPSSQDVLRSRVKTVGIVEKDFKIDGYKFKMVDVGGQRNERRKWIHVFDDVTAIIFVTSLSEYDQSLLEDHTTNRMIESIILFEEICNCRYFKNTSIIVFFNKNDLFEKKIKEVDLNVCFPKYKSGKNYKAAVDYIINKFLATNKNRNRQIYTRVTCATDTENIRVVFDAVKNMILHDNLQTANLI